MINKILTWPIVIDKRHDGSDYYLVYTPGYDFMTQGDTIDDAIYNAQDALASLAAIYQHEPTPDPRSWKLHGNEFVTWISIDIEGWKLPFNNLKTYTLELPEFLVAFAKKEKIDIEGVVTRGLMQRYYEKDDTFQLKCFEYSQMVDLYLMKFGDNSLDKFSLLDPKKNNTKDYIQAIAKIKAAIENNKPFSKFDDGHNKNAQNTQKHPLQAAKKRESL